MTTKTATKHAATKSAHAHKPFRAHHKPELTREENEEQAIPQLDVDMARQALSTITADELKVIARTGIKVPKTVEAAKKVFATYTHEQIQHLYYLGGKQSWDIPEELDEASCSLGNRLNACVTGGEGTELAALLQLMLNSGMDPNSDGDKGEEPRASDDDGDDEDEMERELVAALMGEDKAENVAHAKPVRGDDDEDIGF